LANENNTRRWEKARGSSTLEPVQHELNGSRGAVRQRASAEKQLQVNNVSSLFGKWIYAFMPHKKGQY
jgi:hypothetical protein